MSEEKDKQTTTDVNDDKKKLIEKENLGSGKPDEISASGEVEKPKEKLEEEVIEIKIPDTEVKSLIKDESASEVLVRNALKRGAKISKDQLYPEINRLKGRVSELQSKIKSAGEVDDKSRIDTNRITELEAEKEKVIQEKLEVEDKLNIVEDALVETTHKVDTLASRVDNAELEEYRLKQVSLAEESGKKVIKRLVGGTNKEEIDASIVDANLEYERVEKTVKQAFNLPEKSVAKSTEEVPVKPIVVERIGTDSVSLRGWKKDKATILADTYSQARKDMNLPK